MNIQTPKMPYFSTLLSSYCVATVDTSEITKTHHITFPEGTSVQLIKTYGETFDTYTWEPNTNAVFTRLLQLNCRVVHLSHIQQWCPESMTATILAVGDDGPVIDVSIDSIDRPLLYILKDGIICCGGTGPKHHAIVAPNEYSSFHKVFGTASHVQSFLNRPDRSLGMEDAISIFKALSYGDKVIMNSYWRFTFMNTNNPEQGVKTFTADQIVSFALYLGVSRDKYRPFAMISAIKIFQEDKELFRPCVSLSPHTYTAIGHAKLRSQVIIDENVFLHIVRENPTSKTVCNLMFCLTLKLEGRGLYFDAEDYLCK